MEKKYFFIIDKEREPIRNPKAHPLIFKYFMNKYQFVYLYTNELNHFLNINNNENTTLIYSHLGSEYNIDNDFNNVFINFIKNCNLKINVIVFTGDFWKHKYRNQRYPSRIQEKQYDNFTFNIFKLNNIKTICFCNEKKELEFFHQMIYDNDNIIFNNIWSCYDESFINFNDKPKYKLLISGAMSQDFYPERFVMKTLCYNYEKLEFLEYNENDIKDINNNYNKTLNRYFASFTSNVYAPKNNHIDENHYNTNFLLLKTFEILASGSLLVMPQTSEKILNNIGLYHNINCYLIDFNKNVIEQVENIFCNIEKYDNVRSNGQKIAKEKFTFDIKLNELKEIIEI